MIRILKAAYSGDYKIHLYFDSGEDGIADLADVIQRYAAAESLRDLSEFSKFTLDSWPTLVWPCGFDLAPEMLYERATGKRQEWQNLTVHESEAIYHETELEKE